MGVGVELLGKHVRCPHCKQVVLAPASPGGTAASRPSAPPPPPPVAPPVPKAPESPPAPVFNVSQREAADSILGDPEESEDDVFGNSDRKKPAVPQMPDVPAPPPPPAQKPTPGSPFAFEGERTSGDQPARPPAATRPPAEAISTMILPTPFPTADASHAPPAPVPPPATPVRPAPTPAAPIPVAPAAAGPSNPWAGLDAMAAPAPAVLPAPAPAVFAPAPQPVAVPREPEPKEPREEESPRSAARSARARPPAAGGVPLAVVYALGAYALLVTGLAVYGLFFKSAELPPEHPLSTIPDNFGEFPPADRKKASAARFPLDGELPADQKAKLGGKIEIGQLEIVPLQIEKRKLTLVREGEKKPVEMPAGDGLVLRLRVKNTSPDVAIFPLDPAFQRKETRDDTPATRIVVGGETFAGGPITWPFVRTTREYEREQEDEARPLSPGETRDYFVCSAPTPRVLDAVRSSKEPALWRVQVRRGLIDFRGKDVPVTAIIGVEFRRGDVPGL